MKNKVHEVEITNIEEHRAKFMELLEKSTAYLEVHLKSPVDIRVDGDMKEAHVLGSKADIVFSDDLMDSIGHRACALLGMRTLFGLIGQLQRVYSNNGPVEPGFFLDALDSFMAELTRGDIELQKLLMVARLADLGGHEGINLIKVPIQYGGDMDRTAEDIMRRFNKPKAEA